MHSASPFAQVTLPQERVSFVRDKKRKMPKSDRSGQAAILSTEELDALMQLLPPFYRALFQTARFSAGRINEVLHLKWSNIYPDCIIIPKAITKKKVRTREIPLHPTLKDELGQWRAK